MRRLMITNLITFGLAGIMVLLALLRGQQTTTPAQEAIPPPSQPAIYLFAQTLYSDQRQMIVQQTFLRWFDVIAPNQMNWLLIPNDSSEYLLAPDGKSIAIVRLRDMDVTKRYLTILNLETHYFVTPPVAAAYPVQTSDLAALGKPYLWSPDSRQFLFVAYDDVLQTNRLMRYEIRTGDLMDITSRLINWTNSGWQLQPLGWSRDSQMIAVAGAPVLPGGTGEWRTLLLWTDGAVALEIPGTICPPVWSPDGSTIAMRSGCSPDDAEGITDDGILVIATSPGADGAAPEYHFYEMGVAQLEYSNPVWLDNTRFMTNRGGRLMLFDVPLMTEMLVDDAGYTLDGRGSWLVDRALTPGAILAYHPVRQQLVYRPTDVACIWSDYWTLSRDGRYLAVQDNCQQPTPRQPALRIWDTLTQEEMVYHPQTATERFTPIGFIPPIP